MPSLDLGLRLLRFVHCSYLNFLRYYDRYVLDLGDTFWISEIRFGSRRYVLDLGDTFFITKINLETKIFGRFV